MTHKPHHRHHHHCHHWFLLISGALFLHSIGVGYLLQGLLLASVLTLLVTWLFGVVWGIVLGTLMVFVAIVWWAMP